VHVCSTLTTRATRGGWFDLRHGIAADRWRPNAEIFSLFTKKRVFGALAKHRHGLLPAGPVLDD
jgi:hypothetical protein